MEIKAVLFDVDGTLIDSEKIYNRCWRAAAKEFGCPLTAEHALALRSLDRRLAAQRFLEWFGDPALYPAVRRRRTELMAKETEKEPPRAKPGVEVLMERLEKRGIAAAAVTASPEKRARESLDAVGIGRFVPIILSTERVERGKPFPDVYLFACAALGLRPGECLAVEDSPNGLKSAHDAGCRTVMIPDLTPYGEDVGEIADLHFESLEDLARSGIF